MLRTLATQGVKESLLLRLGRVSPQSPRRWGRMSAHQMVCHLSDSFRGAMGERAAAPVGNWFSRTVLRWVGMRLPLPLPRGYRTLPEIDQEKGGTRPVDFAQDRDALVRLIERFARAERDFAFVPHPLFGPMSEWEWMRWAYVHVRHHLDQFGA